MKKRTENLSHSEIKKRVLEIAQEQFFSTGFKNITMEDFARKLGMSKKTIYKHFSSKEDLIKKVTLNMIEEMSKKAIEIQSNKKIDFVERLKMLTTCLAEKMQCLKPAFFFDVQKNMPELWKHIEEFRKQNILTHFAHFVEEGIEKGIFRKDVNKEVFVMMYANSMQSILNPEIIAQLPLSASQVYEMIITIFFEGLFTENARNKYKIKNKR